VDRGPLIRGRLDSAYPTVRVIERHCYRSHAAFMNHHADFDEHGRVVAWKNHETLAAIFGRHGIRRSFYDVYPDAKRPVILTERCDMASAQRRAYDEFEQRAILELEDGSSRLGHRRSSRDAVRQIMQCPQIFGLCRDETIGTSARDPSRDHARSRAPFVLFSSFISEQERLASSSVRGAALWADQRQRGSGQAGHRRPAVPCRGSRWRRGVAPDAGIDTTGSTPSTSLFASLD
jgi:hypothetical protein